MKSFPQNSSKFNNRTTFFSMSKQLTPQDFQNLDAWVVKQLVPQYEKDVLNKIFKKNE